MSVSIANLPDYPAIKQLARALWRSEHAQRGAAVFIGAGFSSNAERPAPDTPAPPLWSDLRDDMREHLYPHNINDAPYDPLRLAEEYRTYLGQTALNDFLRMRIRDDAWSPGKLHGALLSLPWSDILTTNWDTLLERAARQIGDRTYEAVRTVNDLSHACMPRIIKLHGSVGATDSFVFAEEDYRTYPVRFAPFVNVAKQIFIENELCLLGFSGDDPNFLQWSGWVRDELKDSARRIYLVGALSLGPAKRKLLESRNVAPIDLAPLVDDIEDRTQRHSSALSLFLDFLASSKPLPAHGWRPGKSTAYNSQGLTSDDFARRHQDMPYAAAILTAAMDIWKRDRESYPGWLLCPSEKRTTLRHRTDDAPLPTEGALAEMPEAHQAKLLVEIVWRYRTSLWPLPKTIIVLLGRLFPSDRLRYITRVQQAELSVALLRAARINNDDDEFLQWMRRSEEYTEPGTDLRAEVAYQRSLRERDLLRFHKILDGCEDLLSAPDPMWRLRLAALHCECGNFQEAKRLIGRASKQLQDRQAQDRSSLWLRSRRAWAHWLSRAARLDYLSPVEDEPWPREFQDAQCDPWTELDHLKQDVNDALRKLAREQTRIVPLFKAGTYKDNSNTINIVSSTVIQPDEEFQAITENAGIPLRLDYANLLGDVARDISELSFDPTHTPLAWYLKFLRAVTSHSDPLVERFLGRLGIARLDQSVASRLISTVIEAIAFWRKRTLELKSGSGGVDTAAIERVRLFTEVLARLAARQTEDEAAQSFALAIDLASDKSLRHHWLYEPIGHLAEYAAQSVSPMRRSELVLDALMFPLSTEQGLKDYPWYPNPISFVHGIAVARPWDDQRWTGRIQQLINVVRNDDTSRSEAAMRLVHLADVGYLSQPEITDFSDALWSKTDDAELTLPSKSRLLPHVYAILPAPTGVNVMSIVRARVYSPSPEEKGDLFQAMLGASTAKLPIRPSHTRALELFHSLVAWRPKAAGKSSIGATFARAEERGQSRLLGQVLSEAVVPALTAADYTTENVGQLLDLIDDAKVYTALAALSFFASDGSEDVSVVAKARLRQGILGSRDDEVGSSIKGVVKWAERLQAADWPQNLRDLSDAVLSGLRNRKERDLIHYLWGVRHFCELGALREEDVQLTKESLRDLFDETNYERVEFGSELAITVSLVRAECVRISKFLDQMFPDKIFSSWLQASAEDPLPEVRFAIH